MSRRWLIAALLLLAWPDYPAALGRDPAAGTAEPSVAEEGEHFSFRALEDDRGGFYVVWTHEAPGGIYLIARRVDGGGTASWSSDIAVTRALPRAENWDAFPDGRGGVIVAWALDREVYAQRLSPAGKTPWAADGVACSTGAQAVLPTGVADAAGGAFVVWSEKRYPDRWVLVAQHVSESGRRLWGPEGLRVSLRPSDQRYPRVVDDGQSGVIVAWRDFRENASQLQVQRLDFQGNRLWEDQGLVVTAPGGKARETPILQPLDRGSAVLAWAAPQSGASRLFLQAIGPDARLRWGPAGASVSVGTWDQWNPALYGDGEGNIWVGWEDYRNHAHWQAFAGLMGSGGQMIWPGGAVAVGPLSADQGHVGLADDGQAGIFAAWLDNRFGSPGVVVQQITRDGTLMMGEEGKVLAYRLVNPTGPRVVPLGRGRAAVVWADRQAKGKWALFWKTVRGPSAPPPPSSETEAGREGSRAAPQSGH